MVASQRSRGITLVEIIIALAILVIGLMGLFSAILFATRSNQVNRESTAAMQACQRVVESMMLQNYSDIFALYNSNGADDPGAPNTAPGCVFDVLNDGSITFAPPSGTQVRMFPPRTDSGTGRNGLIQFPQSGNLLVETQPNNLNGLGNNDLNHDGVLDPPTIDHAANYKILPVAVSYSWQGTGGNRTVTYRTILIKR